MNGKEAKSQPKFAEGAKWSYVHATGLLRTYEIKRIEDTMVHMRNVDNDRPAYASIAWMTAGPLPSGAHWTPAEEDDGQIKLGADDLAALNGEEPA